ncbi:MAG: peptidoglycan editing factor PgeF [Microgenomates group bacterium]|nr:peptidoglycan editing factor PgeF [Microgenomates group bacterium]
MIIFNNKLKIYYSTKINDGYFFSGFSTRHNGDARNIVNIFNFFNRHKIKLNKLITLGQIHSANVEYYVKTGSADLLTNLAEDNELNFLLKKIEDTDGVITGDRLSVLTVRTADCLPMIFVDKTANLIGISHQGWRGSLKKLPIKMIDEMIKHGASKKNIIIALGPAIGSCCYNIDYDRYYTFLSEYNGYADKIFSSRGGKIYLNLLLLNYLFLVDYGIDKRNIDFFPFCTACNKKMFFSYRREIKSKKYGEMFSFIEIIG